MDLKLQTAWKLYYKALPVVPHEKFPTPVKWLEDRDKRRYDWEQFVKQWSLCNDVEFRTRLFDNPVGHYEQYMYKHF